MPLPQPPHRSIGIGLLGLLGTIVAVSITGAVATVVGVVELVVVAGSSLTVIALMAVALRLRVQPSPLEEAQRAAAHADATLSTILADLEASGE